MDKQKKILIADDDRMIRMMLTMILHHAGYEVIAAQDGRSAVEKASTEMPDLVLTDGFMPDMHGLLVCKAIKQLDSPPHVVMLSANRPAAADGEQTAYAPDAYLMKPINRSELITCIEEQLSDVASGLCVT